MGLSKKSHKEGKEFANEQMTAVSNWMYCAAGRLQLELSWK